MIYECTVALSLHRFPRFLAAANMLHSLLTLLMAAKLLMVG